MNGKILRASRCEDAIILHLNDGLAGYKTLSLKQFSLRTLKILFLYLFVCNVAVKKSKTILMWVSVVVRLLAGHLVLTHFGFITNSLFSGYVGSFKLEIKVLQCAIIFKKVFH